MVKVMQVINAGAPPPPVAAIEAELLSRTQTAARAESRCVPASVAIEPLRPATASADAFSQIAAQKLQNAWTTYAQGRGCPGALPEHFLVLRLAGGNIRIIGLNAGRTLTSYAQMRSASEPVGEAALAAAQKVDPSCTMEGMDILSTRIAARGADLGPDFYGVRMKGSWSEVWVIKVCGREATVPIAFTADGRGGATPRIDRAKVRLTAK